MECPNIKNRDTLLKYPYVLSIYLIALYSLSYSEFFVFPQPRSNATTTVTFLTSSFSLWFSPILLKLKNSTKCINSRISTYPFFVATPQSPHALKLYFAFTFAHVIFDFYPLVFKITIWLSRACPFEETLIIYFFSIPGRLLNSKLLSVVICWTASSCNNCILSAWLFPCFINMAL